MSGDLLHLSDAEFEDRVLKSDLPVLVDFWAPWCGPCRMISPIIEELSGEYTGQVVFAKMNTDENPTTPAQYDVMSIPTLLLFKEGRLVDRAVGGRPKPALKQWIDGAVLDRPDETASMSTPDRAPAAINDNVLDRPDETVSAPAPDHAPASTSRREEKDVQVGAIAVVSDVMMMFDSTETFNNVAANIVHTRWPGVELPPSGQIQITGDFKGGEDEAKAELLPMIQQVMASANLDQRNYRLEIFSVHGEVLASTAWCAVAIRATQPEVAGDGRMDRSGGASETGLLHRLLAALRRIFGRKNRKMDAQNKLRDGAPKSPHKPTGDKADFTRVFNNHLQRMRTATPQLRPFLDQYFKDAIVTQIAAAAADKMGLTRSDGKQHSTVFAQGPVVYHISTLPVDMSQARDWFGRSGGYTKLLENAWNSFLPRSPDSSVWCHIIYGPSGKRTWAHMAICTVKRPAPVDAAIMPVEFLTLQERQQLGL